MATKVTRHEAVPGASGPADTPSQELVRKATEEFSAVDGNGRQYTLRKPGILAQYRLVEIVGGERAKNQMYMAMVLPLTYVTAIDGERVPSPTNQRELEALIVRLGEEGVNAVSIAVAERFGPVDPELDRDGLKNS